MASVEVQILHGLPGSGKTYYSEKVAQEEKDKKVDITHLDDALIRGHILDWDTDICILDGLFLTNEDIIAAIKRLEEYKLTKLDITIVCWDKNRELCLKNDQSRREKSSKDTILRAPFDDVDVEWIEKETGYKVKIINKEVVLKPDYVVVAEKNNINGLIGDYLFSDSWVISGTTRSYDDNWKPVYHSISGGDEPSDFETLYSFIEALKPDLTALQLRYIQKNLIEYEEYEDNDYYSSITYGRYKVDIKKLMSYLSS